MIELTEKTQLSDLQSTDALKVYFYDGESDLGLLGDLEKEGHLEISNLKLLEISFGSFLDYGPDQRIINSNFDLLIKFIRANPQLEVVKLGSVRDDALSSKQTALLNSLLKGGVAKKQVAPKKQLQEEECPTVVGIHAEIEPMWLKKHTRLRELQSAASLSVSLSDKKSAFQALRKLEAELQLELENLEAVQIYVGSLLEGDVETDREGLAKNFDLLIRFLKANPQLKTVKVNIYDDTLLSVDQSDLLKSFSRGY
jgi:hypothetical protein